MDFERIRKEMEWKARQKAKVQIGIEEITLEQIYAQLEEQAGIPKEKGIFNYSLIYFFTSFSLLFIVIILN